MHDCESGGAAGRDSWLPTYDETALFFIAVTCILLLLAPSGLWNELAPLMLRPSEAQTTVIFGLLGLLFAAGLSIYHVFTPRHKNMWEKNIFVAFVLVTNGSAGVVSGLATLRSGAYSTAVFPLVNLLFTVLLIYRLAIADIDSITDDDAHAPGLIVGLLVLVAIFVCCLVLWHLPWAMTFSVCVSYSTIASRIVTRLDQLWAMR